MYFNRGSLPWQGIRAKTKKEKYDAIKEKKLSTTIEALCNGYPDEFASYLKYCQKLGFEETPNYQPLLKGFQEVYKKLGYENDNRFDWSIMKTQFKVLTKPENKKISKISHIT